MKISDVGLSIVMAFEGCLAAVPSRPGHFKPYVCPAGVLTIGWGHTNHHEPKFKAGEVWSQAQCDAVLKLDMAVFERHVTKIAPEVQISHRYDALVSWSYNTGGPADSAVWRYARIGNVEETRIRLSRWNKANGKVLNGLVRRRESEADLFEGKVQEALETAGAVKIFGRMAQRVDRPTVPPAEVARQTKRETATAAGGVATAGGGAATKATTEKPSAPVVPTPAMPTASTIAIVLGIAIVAVAIVLIVRKAAKLNADYA